VTSEPAAQPAFERGGPGRPAPGRPPAGSYKSSDRSRLTGLLLFAFVLLVYGGTAGGSLATTDAVVTYTLTKQIVEHGTVALPGDMLGNTAHRGVDGHYYSPFGLAQSIYNVPFYLAGRQASRLIGQRIDRADAVEKAIVALGNCLPMAATAWLIYLFAAGAVPHPPAALAAAAASAFATPAWPYARFGFNVPLSAFAVTGAAYLAWRASRTGRSAVPAGLLLSVALLTRHELLLTAVPVGLWLVLDSLSARESARRLLGMIVGLAPGIAVWLAYNAVRFGNALDAGYLRDPTPAFGSSVLTGTFGLLLSPTAALLVYAPLTLAAVAAARHVWRDEPRLLVLLFGPLLLFVAFYAQLGNWMGGRSYGPRYLVPMIPLTTICLAYTCHVAGASARRWLIAACAAATLVQVPGVLVDFAKIGVQHARAHGAPSHTDRLYDWSTAPLVLNARASAAAVSRTARVLAGVEPVPAGRSGRDDRDFSQQFAFSLDFWWLYLYYMGVSSRGLSVTIGLVWLAAVFLLGRWLYVSASR
jgi:hypothetical protein